MKFTKDDAANVIQSFSKNADFKPTVKETKIGFQISGNEIPGFIESFDNHLATSVQRTITLVKEKASEFDPSLSRGDELPLLSLENENAYSDWLAWLLQQNGTQHSLGNALSEIFGNEFTDGSEFVVAREEVVDHGHENQSGRLDLSITNERLKRFQVIEVKVRAPTSDELKKHEGYIKSFEARYSGWSGSFSLLTPEGMNDIVNPSAEIFKCVSWRTIALCIRRHVIAASQMNVYHRAMAATFCAALESNVLGYSNESLRKVLSGSPLFAPWTLTANGFLSYLEECYGV